MNAEASRFADALRAFVVRRVRPQDADDVVQDVLMRIQRGAGGVRESERAEAWVYGVARRTIADYFRARGRTREVGIETSLDDLAATPPTEPVHLGDFDGDHSVHEEVLGWLRPIAEGLPDGYREALLMADFEGRTQREVARSLGLSLSGAKSRVQRARILLGKRLRACCELHFDREGRVVDFRRRRGPSRDGEG